MATQLLASAGANYYMDVYLNNDRMLAYFDTSAHDNQSLREVHGRTPTPEFLDWALARGIFKKSATGAVVRGPNWGNPRIFCASEAEFDELLRVTPAMYGFENAGPRPANDVSRTLRSNQALARQAIECELDLGLLRETADFLFLETEARDKESHLNSPHLGTRLSAQCEAELEDSECDVQIVVADGLSAEAVHANLADLYPVLVDGLESRNLRLGRPIAVRYGRVKLAEHFAECTGTPLTILLIGERPGGDALASRSLSAYMVYQLIDEVARNDAVRFSGNATIRFEYTVISNIYSGGLIPVEAGSVIAEKAWQILEKHAAGNRLEKML
jgi:ethanolamine ammonia-lyase large subunit